MMSLTNQDWPLRPGNPGLQEIDMPPRRTRGTFWQFEEVSLLLKIVLRLGFAADFMSSAHQRNRGAYHAIARKLTDAGYSRNANQCRTKFKRLKCEFMASLTACQGIPSCSGRIPHHHSMMRLWIAAGRPRWEDRHHEATSYRHEGEEEPTEETGSEVTVPMDEMALQPSSEAVKQEEGNCSEFNEEVTPQQAVIPPEQLTEHSGDPCEECIQARCPLHTVNVPSSSLAREQPLEILETVHKAVGTCLSCAKKTNRRMDSLQALVKKLENNVRNLNEENKKLRSDIDNVLSRFKEM
ncbi:uncharacterized protein LOC129326250 [Eublepharis macularius]|uniref:Uncharacterized protein LOC129326250 n=1 Tax=Eublepharis macularius TaxID=481883 RepID=A0AA97KUG6_EUBMA|nr:uncharacterized protein LOC129326250 [Eublepharis macularius]